MASTVVCFELQQKGSWDRTLGKATDAHYFKKTLQSEFCFNFEEMHLESTEVGATFGFFSFLLER